MASKQLTANVRLNTKQAEQKLKNIAKAIDALNRATGKQTNAYAQVNAALNKTVKLKARVKQETDKTTSSTKKWATALKAVNSKLNGSKSLISGIGGKLKALAGTYLGVMGVRTVIDTSDAITSAENKLNYINGGDTSLTEGAMSKMYTSAQNVRMGYTDMMSNVSKSMALAPDAFGGSIDNAIRFQEIMAEAYTVGGASAQEMSTSMYQMIQALGAGVLAGDELRSVREGAPLAYQAIEEFAQGVYNTEESLKDLASQGKITSDMVVAAIMDAGDKMDSAFAQTKWRFQDVWTEIKNAAQRSFLPISKMMSDTLNEAVDNGLIQKIERLFANVAKGIMIVFTIIKNVVGWIADNWDWLKHAIVGAIIAMIAWTLIKTGISVFCAYQEMKAWMLANNVTWATIGSLLTVLAVIAVIVMAVLALVYVFILWKQGAIDTCTAIVAALLIVGIAIVLIGLLLGSWITVIVGLVIAAIGLIINWLDYFLAILYSIVSVIWNLIVALVTAIIKAAILPLLQAWDNFANFFGNLFNDPIAAIIHAFEGLADTVLSILQTIASGIDAIFGSNLADTVQGWRNGLSTKADELANKWGNGTYEEKSNVADQFDTLLTDLSTGLLWNTSDAWNTGMSHGAAAKDWMNDLGSQFQSDGSGSGLDNMMNKLGLDSTQFDSLFDPNNINGVAGDVNDIADNTGDIADSMELTEEDLKYLRKIAEMEWKKEYTTANVKIDMSNVNTINNQGDLDNWAVQLGEILQEELQSVADGVYAY